ncbi:hypothetical protein B0H16DRAFT_1702495 [Mycena metata]|uniref:Uncharacterized protein n=1 Tax=Mycena metata TaxID=1033252 RepID=A0AAD7H624_9AGAR|nr:hypothetical protein B0H16DRAFT_1702495 [Mycena metata]
MAKWQALGARLSINEGRRGGASLCKSKRGLASLPECPSRCQPEHGSAHVSAEMVRFDLVDNNVKYFLLPPSSSPLSSLLNSLVVDPNHLRKLQAASNPKTCVSVPTRASPHPTAVVLSMSECPPLPTSFVRLIQAHSPFPLFLRLTHLPRQTLSCLAQVYHECAVYRLPPVHVARCGWGRRICACSLTVTSHGQTSTSPPSLAAEVVIRPIWHATLVLCLRRLAQEDREHRLTIARRNNRDRPSPSLNGVRLGRFAYLFQYLLHVQRSYNVPSPV